MLLLYDTPSLVSARLCFATNILIAASEDRLEYVSLISNLLVTSQEKVQKLWVVVRIGIKFFFCTHISTYYQNSILMIELGECRFDNEMQW